MRDNEMIAEEMRISLESILPSLAKNLYGNDWRISIRELLQNCNDANVEAQINNRDLSDGSLEIRIITSRQDKTLIIQDNGIGMTLEEVKENLATIGAGNKRKRLEKFSQDPTSRNYDKVREIIGQYGIGFLASFIIAKEVEVITKSRRDPKEPAQKCVFSGETKWYHEEYKSNDIKFGTRMTLHLNENVIGGFKGPLDENPIDLLNPNQLDDEIKKYGDLIRYPIIRCNSLDAETGMQLNIMKAPWEETIRSPEDNLNFFKRRYSDSNTPIHMELFQLTKSKNKVDARGLLYFPRLGPNEIAATGSQLFVKRMFIRDNFVDLLPEWAKFVSVIVDCPDLTPTLDRNNVITHDQAFADLKLSLADLITEKLIEYARNSKLIFNQILNEHLRAIQYALISDANRTKMGEEFFFRNLIEYVPFRVISQNYPSGIYKSLKDYRNEYSKGLLSSGTSLASTGQSSKDPIYYLHDPAGRRRLETLVVRKDIPVISANSDPDFLLIDAYGKFFVDNVNVIDITTVLPVYYDTENKEDKDKWTRVINFYTAMVGGPQTVEVARFEPSSMPGMLVVADIDKGKAKQLEEYFNLGANVLSPQMKRQMEIELRRIKEHGASFTFYINANNSLMASILQEMSQDTVPRELAYDILEEIYHNAQIYANFVSGTEDHIFSHRTNLLEKVLKDSKELVNTKHENDSLKLNIANLSNDMGNLKSVIEGLRTENMELELIKEECIDISKIPVIPEMRYCAALIADLTKSTWTLASVDFKDRGDIFNRYIMDMKKIVEKHEGFFDKFTGDGLIALFGLKKPDNVDEYSKKQICMSAIECASEIAMATESFFKLGDVAKIVTDAAGPHAPSSRISIASGNIAFGRFGGSGTALGLPIIHAARIISKKDFFNEERKIIYTEAFLEDLKLPPSQNPNPIEKEFRIDGSYSINVYPSHI